MNTPEIVAGVLGLGGPELMVIFLIGLVIASVPTLLIVVALLASRRSSAVGGAAPAPEILSKKCPDCAEAVKAEARLCKHCGHAFAEKEACIA